MLGRAVSVWRDERRREYLFPRCGTGASGSVVEDGHLNVEGATAALLGNFHIRHGAIPPTVYLVVFGRPDVRGLDYGHELIGLKQMHVAQLGLGHEGTVRVPR